MLHACVGIVHTLNRCMASLQVQLYPDEGSSVLDSIASFKTPRVPFIVDSLDTPVLEGFHFSAYFPLEDDSAGLHARVERALHQIIDSSFLQVEHARSQSAAIYIRVLRASSCTSVGQFMDKLRLSGMCVNAVLDTDDGCFYDIKEEGPLLFLKAKCLCDLSIFINLYLCFQSRLEYISKQAVGQLSIFYATSIHF